MEENFNELLEKSLLDFKYKEGQIIKGTVLSIVNDTVVVDVGLKSEGRIPIKEFHSPGEEHNVKVGEKYDVYLEKLENKRTDIVFFQAGVDSLTFDSLGHLNLSHEGIKKRNELVFNFCKKQNTPVVVFMGGGYSNPIDHTVNAISELFYQCRDFAEQFRT